MFDDPNALTSVEWNNIHNFLKWFWIYFPIVVTFAITMLTAHAIIPSLVVTGHLPESTQRLRVPMTGFAARVFAAGVLEQLSLIALGRAAGFSLNEIAAMFGADGRPRIERQQLLEKADELDQSIKQLTAMRDGLRHAAACSAPSHLECPRFRRLMGLAGAGVIGERRNGTSAKT